MLNLLMNDDGNFAQQLRKLPAPVQTNTPPPELSQWLHYWNDADTVAGNVRKLEHWLQRARKHS